MAVSDSKFDLKNINLENVDMKDCDIFFDLSDETKAHYAWSCIIEHLNNCVDMGTHLNEHNNNMKKLKYGDHELSELDGKWYVPYIYPYIEDPPLVRECSHLNLPNNNEFALGYLRNTKNIVIGKVKNFLVNAFYQNNQNVEQNPILDEGWFSDNNVSYDFSHVYNCNKKMEKYHIDDSLTHWFKFRNNNADIIADVMVVTHIYVLPQDDKLYGFARICFYLTEEFDDSCKNPKLVSIGVYPEYLKNLPNDTETFDISMSFNIDDDMSHFSASGEYVKYAITKLIYAYCKNEIQGLSILSLLSGSEYMTEENFGAVTEYSKKYKKTMTYYDSINFSQSSPPPIFPGLDHIARTVLTAINDYPLQESEKHNLITTSIYWS